MSDVMADRTPPHNIEAEQAVLGAILIDQDALTSASELLVPDSFYRTKHQKIFEVMRGLSDKGEPIDLVMMTSAMADQGLLEEVGGVSYLAELAEVVPTAANVEYYARIIAEKALLRRLIRTATHNVSDGYEREDDVDRLLN